MENLLTIARVFLQYRKGGPSSDGSHQCSCHAPAVQRDNKINPKSHRYRRTTPWPLREELLVGASFAQDFTTYQQTPQCSGQFVPPISHAASVRLSRGPWSCSPSAARRRPHLKASPRLPELLLVATNRNNFRGLHFARVLHGLRRFMRPPRAVAA